MLRLLIAWRLVRVFRPLMLLGLLGVALSVALHGPALLPADAQRQLSHLTRTAQQRLRPLVLNARHALTVDLSRTLR